MLHTEYFIAISIKCISKSIKFIIACKHCILIQQLLIIVVCAFGTKKYMRVSVEIILIIYC